MRIYLAQLVITALWSLPMCMAAMLAARLAGENIPVGILPVFGGVLLMVAGVLSLREAVSGEKPDFKEDGRVGAAEANLLGIAIAMDASVAAFSLGILGADILVVPFAFAGTHFLLVWLGNFLGFTGLSILNKKRVKVLPGALLIIMGALKALGV